MIAAQAVLTGRIAGDPSEVRPSLVGWIAGEPPSLEGTITDRLGRAYDAPTRRVAHRVILDRVDVTADLVGDLTLREERGRTTRTGSFTLRSAQCLPHRTVSTWTRAPLEIVTVQGPPGKEVEVLELRGRVDTCDSDGTTVRVTFSDDGILTRDLTTCYEVPPGVGLTRGEIVRRVCAGAGATVDVPDGAVYTKPLETAGERLHAFLESFGEPEGWAWRTRNDGALEARTVRLERPPRPPDHVWRLDDLAELPSITPPREAVSTWIVRGTSITLVDEVGLTTEIETVEVRALYAPAVAALQQLEDGTLVPIGAGSVAELRTVSRLTTYVTKQGPRVVRQVVLEEGYRNPAAAQFRTSGAQGLGQGPAPGGLYWDSALVDSQGRFVRWFREKFGPVAQRESEFFYDGEGTQIGARLAVWRWHRRRRAIRRTESPPEGVDVAGAYVGDDGASYRGWSGGRIEEWGLAEQQLAALEYEPAGAVTTETLDDFAWYARGAAVDPLVSEWVNADGTGQDTVDAAWQRYQQTIRRAYTDDSGRLRGETDLSAGFTRVPAVNGRYDWGDGRSNAVLEQWRTQEVTQRSFRIVTPDTYQVSEVARGQQQPTRTLSGRPPMPVYRSSPWQQLEQGPFEVVLHDDLVEAWFGRRAEVLDHPHLLSLEEAERLARRLQRRDLALQIRVRRPETSARLFDTVLLEVPPLALTVRGLIIARSVTRSLAPARAKAEYVLEVETV
ncbi:MAG: hypothetical protein AAGC60_30635 [Acidobacteriota bacterium]